MMTYRNSILTVALLLLAGGVADSTSSGDEPSTESLPPEPADAAADDEDRDPQYEHEDIVVPAAWAEEPRRESVSVEKAAAYVEDGAIAWSGSRNCVACHTTGAYLGMRPMLTESLGRPANTVRELFVSDLAEREAEADEDLELAQSGLVPAHVANIAWGLAEWDAHVTGELSDETRRALTLMFRLQHDDGSFSNQDCWPPFESSPYQAATVAAMAVATAPGWQRSDLDEVTRSSVQKLRDYLRDTPPPHAYAELLLLRAATRWPELMDNARRRRAYTDIFSRRNPDGGWAMRDFATPDQWGDAGRAEKLKAEPEFTSPPSDAHMTALVLITYMDAGMSRDDRLIRRGVDWLKAQQRESGRWWTRSLNTDGPHFITYSASIYALAALDMSQSIPTNRD